MLWFASLRGRVTLVTVAVAVLAVLVTGLVSFQLVRQATVERVRVQLSDQVNALAQSSVPLSLADLRERVRSSADPAVVAVVSASGAVSGGAARYLTGANRRILAAGGSLSVTHRESGSTVLLEARQSAAGGVIVLARSLATVDSETRATTGKILLALGIGIVVAVIAGALLAGWLSRSLVSTAAIARRMASGERGLSIEPHSPSEVADVADALASLDRALGASEGRQRDFLLSISHELRTPLTALRGYAEALADGLISGAELPAVGATLVAETERLDHFVADLLELARLEADDFSIVRTEVVVARILEEVKLAWSARSDRSGIALQIESSAVTAGSIRTDPRRLRQVIDGLVENALRVAPEGTAVKLGAVTGNGRATITVQDAGPGMSDDDLAIAFERGTLRERYRDIRPVGTGLGLSIAARLTARLGGTISMSQVPDGGTLLTVTIG